MTDLPTMVTIEHPPGFQLVSIARPQSSLPEFHFTLDPVTGAVIPNNPNDAEDELLNAPGFTLDAQNRVFYDLEGPPGQYDSFGFDPDLNPIVVSRS